MPFLFLVGVIVGLVLGYALVVRKHRPRYFASAEYWVFLPGDQMPPQERIMDRMMRENPFGKRGRSPIGTAEGLVFSDVRLHIALVLRSKNPHVFRPDLMDDVEVDAEILRHLAEAQSLVKVRYVSEDPLPDRRHIQFLIHAANAVAHLGNGALIYDRTTERMIPRDELDRELAASVDATRPEIHLRVLWKGALTGGHVETRGLVKIGIAEMMTGNTTADQRLIVSQIVEQAAEQVWRAAEMPERLDVDAYGDQFRVVVDQVKNRLALVRVQRVHAS